MTQWTDKLSAPKLRRAAIALYVVCLGGLIAGFVAVSLVQVEQAGYIQGAATLEKGRPNPMRGVILEAPTGQYITDAHVDVGLVDGMYGGPSSLERLAQADGAALAGGHPEPSGHTHLSAEVPDDWPVGEAALVVSAAGAEVPPFRAGASVSVVPRSVPANDWPSRTDRLPDDEALEADAASPPSQPGLIRIDMLPGDGRVCRGLPSQIYLRTTDRATGKPVSVQLNVAQVDGRGSSQVPGRVHTGELGLARVDVTAMTDQIWHVVAGSASHKGADSSRQTTLQITTVPSQVCLQLDQVLAVAGEAVDGRIASLFRSGEVMVDLYNGDDWIDAAALAIEAPSSGVRTQVPRLDDHGLLYRMQVYRSFFAQRSGWDVEYLVAARGHRLADYQKAAEALVGYVAAHQAEASVGADYFTNLAGSDIFERTRDKAKLRGWIEALLEAVPRHFEAPPTLINTQKEARDRLESWRQKVKGDLMVLTAIALVVGLAVVGYWVIVGAGSYRRQHQMLRDVDAELNDDPHGARAVSDRSGAKLDESIAEGNVVVGLQVFIVVATLVLFSLGILLLLSYL